MLVTSNVQIPLPSPEQLFLLASGDIKYIARVKVVNNLPVIQELFQLTGIAVSVGATTVNGLKFVKVNDTTTINEASSIITQHCGSYA